mmetsp:Transcript_61874/g.144932  ORF Transcript_61874/g.144932 Transcript_61874/m.144932 type:complete len:356 (-) Transcript_61874:722-1789(-)
MQSRLTGRVVPWRPSRTSRRSSIPWQLLVAAVETAARGWILTRSSAPSRRLRNCTCSTGSQSTWRSFRRPTSRTVLTRSFPCRRKSYPKRRRPRPLIRCLPRALLPSSPSFQRPFPCSRCRRTATWMLHPSDAPPCLRRRRPHRGHGTWRQRCRRRPRSRSHKALAGGAEASMLRFPSPPGRRPSLTRVTCEVLRPSTASSHPARRTPLQLGVAAAQTTSAVLMRGVLPGRLICSQPHFRRSSFNCSPCRTYRFSSRCKNYSCSPSRASRRHLLRRMSRPRATALISASCGMRTICWPGMFRDRRTSSTAKRTASTTTCAVRSQAMHIAGWLEAFLWVQASEASSRVCQLQQRSV